MPEEEPVCDCEEGEPPDADPGCCGADTCEENETCCNETTCVLTSTFQTDSNNCGDCDIVCEPEETCVAGSCVGGSEGCCTHWNCVYDGTTYQYTATWSEERSEADCIMPITEFSGDPSIPCNSTPLNMNNNYNTWSAEPCPDECAQDCATTVITFNWSGQDVHCPGGVWDGISFNGWNTLQTCPCGYEAWYPTENGNPNYVAPFFNEAGFCGDNQPVASSCKCPDGGGGGGLSVPSDKPVEVKERPCYQEECETQVSTWMAEPSGEPNEEGLYKVKWMLLDDCPGACCSDQPTQPEFVKTSTLVDAPCKCGCN